ncbi:glycosyltransferase [Actinobacillus equuli]|uniref:tetratricopeptide repeat-containing glycosyltransferase family protein n=1 Tax=Actinobacillus equuli TaxID=718 RepID=UPI0024436502|nr:glycosyltransferase [Actinobacillus equuli]WGE86627.1 glycosyltransferase [Actinobacillus equuli subsp. haemolyticus]
MAEMTFEQYLALLVEEQDSAATPFEWLAILRKYDEIIRLLPDKAVLYHNRCTVLQNLGLYQLALKDANKAVELAPNYAIAWCNKAMLHNLLGDYLQGWQAYEWRWQTGLPAFEPLEINIPQWQGENIGDAKILFHVEQGFGDNIQFVRYALEMKRQGLNVVVLNHSGIENLLNYNLAQYGIETMQNGGRVTGLAYHLPMLSAPLVFGSTLENIPYSSGYLQAQPEFLAKWRTKITACSTQKHLKIGVVWAGSAKHNRNASRSLPFELFSQLFALDADFHCLQKELNEADDKRSDLFENLHIWQQDISDFSDTAALIAQMDLVISVDTSVAHLAAAMGKPTWIMLSYHPDFRWLLTRQDSPWYDSVKLFRQEASLTWQSVIKNIQQQLQQVLKENT